MPAFTFDALFTLRRHDLGMPPEEQFLAASADQPAALYLSLQGAVRLYWAGETQGLPGPKLLTLLAYLHLRGQVSRNELAEMFWPTKNRSGGLQSVRQALSQLRRQAGVGEWLHENEQGVSISAISEVSEFRRLAQLGEDAAALKWCASGELLAGLSAPSAAFELWLTEERQALDELRLKVLHRHSAHLTQLGKFEEAREALSQALTLAPDAEELYRAQMELEYRAGHTTKALELFEACRQMLQQELGLEPEAETLALLARIENSGAASHQRGQLVSQAQALPQANEPLCGREALRQQLLALLHGQLPEQGGRVLLHGLGGLGKTRLASAVAATMLEGGGQVLWLEVGSDSAQTVLETIRELLSIKSPAQPSHLASALTAQNVRLIVLDNADSTYAAQHLLASLPAAVPVLVTSRLRLPGLKATELPRLERESSLQLLHHHLGEKRTLTANQEALCSLLGDHPFALRLAALTLATGGPDVMHALHAAPHDTICTLLEQSLSSVSPREYEVFLALGSLYAPQATPELLTCVLGRPQQEVETALWQLAERGLVSRESRAGSDTLCFRMHDLTWHAARERQAHLPHHLVSAVTHYVQSYTHQADLLATDLPHLLGAAAQAKQHLPPLMAGWLGGGYIGARGFPTAALHLLEQATQQATAQGDWETASLLGGKHADIAQALLGNQAEAIARLLEAAALAQKADNQERQAVQLALAGQMEAANNWPEAWEHLQAAQALAHHTGPTTRARVLGQVAMAHAYRKEFRQAHQLLCEARELLQSELALNPSSAAVLAAYLGTLGNLGQAEKRLGNLEQALALKQEMGALAAQKEERLYQARAALDQGELLHELGRPSEAMTQLRYAIELSQSIGSGSLEGMARRLLQDIASVN